MAEPSFKLLSGEKIPALGFGTYSAENLEGKSYESVLYALKAGYRHLDCAAFYKNEAEIGDAITKFLETHPDVSRKDLFITTKFWNHMHAPEDVKLSLQQSLKKLRVDYVDLYLVHWPIASKKDENGDILKDSDGNNVLDEHLTEHPEITWKAMEEVHEAGLAKSIGVSNWTVPRLKSLLKDVKIIPAANQVEIHPYLWNEELLQYCKSEGIILEAYSPLGQLKEGKGFLDAVPELAQLVEKTGYTLAQVLIAWGIQRGYVVLPKSFTESRIQKNFELVTLDDQAMKAINDFASTNHKRLVNMPKFFGVDLWPEDSK